MIRWLLISLLALPSAGLAQFTPGSGGEGNTKKDSIRCGRNKAYADCNEDLQFEVNTGRVYHVKSGKPFTGTCESCHSNGNRENLATFRDGKEDGVSESWYPDGSKETMRTHAMGSETGEWKYWFPKSKGGKLAWEFQYLNGELNGKCIWYFPDSNQSVKKIEHYKTGKLDGLVTKYYEPEKLKSEINFKNGSYDGKYKTYFKNGQVSIDMEYVSGIEHGPLKHYFDNGQLSKEGVYVGGRKNEKWVSYFDNGVIRESAEYNMDVLNGKVQEFYKEDGRIKRDASYEEGYLMSEFLFDEFGNYIDDKGKQITKEEADNRDKLIRATSENRREQNRPVKWWQLGKKKKKKAMLEAQQKAKEESEAESEEGDDEGEEEEIEDLIPGIWERRL